MIARLNKFELDNTEHNRTTTLDVAALLAQGYVLNAWMDGGSFSAGVVIEDIHEKTIREIRFLDWDAWLQASPVANPREVFAEHACHDMHHWDAAAEAFLTYLAGGESQS